MIMFKSIIEWFKGGRHSSANKIEDARYLLDMMKLCRETFFDYCDKYDVKATMINKFDRRLSHAKIAYTYDGIKCMKIVYKDGKETMLFQHHVETIKGIYEYIKNKGGM